MIFLHHMPKPLQWMFPDLTWCVPSSNKIYLTFDDGPIPGLTPYVLGVLDHFNIKATFFSVGENLVKSRKLAELTLDRGHRLGNHTHNHLDGWKTHTTDYLSNLEKCQKELLGLANSNINLFRPPYGKIKPKQISHLKNQYKIIMWSVLSGDFLQNLSPEACLSNTIKATKPGAIILFHENVKAGTNMKYALPRFIENSLNKGYEFALL